MNVFFSKFVKLDTKVTGSILGGTGAGHNLDALGVGGVAP